MARNRIKKRMEIRACLVPVFESQKTQFWYNLKTVFDFLNLVSPVLFVFFITKKIGIKLILCVSLVFFCFL